MKIHSVQAVQSLSETHCELITAGSINSKYDTNRTHYSGIRMVRQLSPHVIQFDFQLTLMWGASLLFHSCSLSF
ncbi:hypothetical protein ACQKL5_09040 [Peribacillus sp. NPDC097675]|uniref:hypothetical protein n=1 Tax=Peribacillus sp. NPDC097675 TaxID=3390618 RepID=UPI003D02C7A2